MGRSNIPDVSSDENGDLKLQQKFRLHLDEEEATHFFQADIFVGGNLPGSYQRECQHLVPSDGRDRP